MVDKEKGERRRRKIEKNLSKHGVYFRFKYYHKINKLI